MTTTHLHVFAIDGTGDILEPHVGTGWAWLTVPRLSIFGDQEPEISAWDYGLFHGCQAATAIVIARKAREIQGLDYKTGPAIVLDGMAIKLSAMVQLLDHEKRMGDSTLHFQHRDDASKLTDDSLRRLSMYVGNEQISTAVKHGLTLLRRAKQDEAFAHERWPYPPNGMP
jgi:hypothetical protein